MMPIDYVRDHKTAIHGVLAHFHAKNPRLVPEDCAEADVVLLVEPEANASYFDIFEMEDALAAELKARVTVLTDGSLQGSDRDHILSIAQKV